MSNWDFESHTASITLSQRLLGLASGPNMSPSNEAFFKEFKDDLVWNFHARWSMSDSDISNATMRYSDRFLTHSGNPMNDVYRYIERVGFTTLGGLQTWLTILGYRPKKLLCPTQLSGGIGEGIVGHWFVTLYDKNFVVRPVGEACDGIVTEPRGMNPLRFGPIEVKTSTVSKDRAIYDAGVASRNLLREYVKNRGIGTTGGGLGRADFALSVGVYLNKPVEVYCIEFR